MKHKEEFKAWLDAKGFKSTASYLTYLNAVEEAVGDIDVLFNDVVKAAIEKKFTEKKFGKNKVYTSKDAKKAATNGKSAALKYWEFLNDKG